MDSPQRNLFDTEPPAWELEDQEHALVATVVIPGGPEHELDYSVPDVLAGSVQVGQRLRVPLGRGDRAVTGYCVALGMRKIGAKRLKAASGVVDRRSLLAPTMLELTRWIADRYMCGWAQVLDAVVPAAVRGQAGTRTATLLSVDKDVLLRIDSLELPEKQVRALRTLAECDQPLTPQELARRAGCTQAPVTALRRKGLVVSRRQRVRNERQSELAAAREPSLTLNADQRTALDAILAQLEGRRHETILIHGVTGSGKTEVYLQAIQRVIEFGRQAIVLVPEISLTPQTKQRFRARFDHVAVLHSHLSDAERHRRWEEIAAGRVQVVVGARSAVFAPVPQLGLIVLDEEHESSFKQETAPRYHARDVARQRAAAEGVPLVLGSATPSLESWHYAATGKYRLVRMPRRVENRPLPGVRIVDLREPEHRQRSRGAISRELHRAMTETLSDGNQVILLLNRRGFSTHIQCPGCGYVVTCPHCEIALTHHRQEESARCHYCDYQSQAPAACPQCKFAGIRYGGLGTQRLEAEVRARFPDQSCLRMDTDSMRKSGSHEEALARFRRGEVRILLGTQMIAKGLDFPNVTLVGVINADTALHLPDFRAAERTFQLVTQVAGRTGRGAKGGRVLVQTFSPDHAAIVAAARHNYEQFARHELPIRRAHRYPPFASMVRLVVRGSAQKTVHAFADHLAERLRQCCETPGLAARVLGPAPAPIPKLRDLFRFQLQVQALDGESLHAAVRTATADVKAPREVQWIVDIDPLDML
ncbi:MAG: primosomal protein N' [Pirellulales bacterium]